MTKFAIEVPRWRRLLAEGFVIVASILLAFGIDAWWDSKNERDQATALAAALVRDFETTRQRFDEARQRYEIVLNSMEQILVLAENGPVPEAQWARVDTILSRVFYSMNTFDPPMGAVETILSSGRLDLFHDENLLAELTRWTSDVADLKTIEQAGSQHFFEHVYPVLAERLELQDLDKDIPWDVPWPHDPTRAGTLLSDREFRSVIYMHYVLYYNIVAKLDRIEATIRRVSAVAERELGA